MPLAWAPPPQAPKCGQWPQLYLSDVDSSCVLDSPGTAPGWVLGRVVAQPGTAASCLGWLLTPELEAQEILQGPDLQGHSLAQRRGHGWEACGPSEQVTRVSSLCWSGAGCAHVGR